MSDSRKQSLVLVILLLLTILLLGFFLRTELKWTGGELGVPLDDAWIHYQFARNIAQGDGFSFNPGQPTAGSTAPLWTILLAGVAALSQPLLTSSLLFSALFLLLTVVFTFILAKYLSEDWRFGFVAALAVALTGRLLWAGLAGMETTAFAATSVAAVWLYTKRGLGAGPALLFGLASQLRPEGHLLFLLALIDAIWKVFQEYQQGQHKRLPFASLLRQFGPALLVYGLIALPYPIFSLVTSGRPLPNTFYAKAGTEHFFSWRTLGETIRLHWQDNYLAILLVIPGLIPTWRRCRLVVAWVFSLLILNAFTVDFVWHHGRYTLPLVPFVLVIAALGLQWLLERVPIKARSWLTAVLLLGLILSAGVRLSRWATLLGQNSREILAMDVALGHWLAQHTPPDAIIAVDDIGAIGYLSGREIFDLNGLISPEMWPVIREEAQGHLRNEATTRILSQEDVDFLAIFPLWHYELANNTQVADPVARFQVDSRTIIGEQEAVVYRAQWPYLFDEIPPEQPLATLGETIQLLDYEFEPPSQTHNEIVLSLFWLNLAPQSERYDVFVHVLDKNGEIATQSDSQPVGGLAPTNRWLLGDVIRDGHFIQWPDGQEPGEYAIRVGMYLRESGRRLPATGVDVSDDSIFLTSFLWPAGDSPG